jgi:hypothetical protein
MPASPSDNYLVTVPPSWILPSPSPQHHFYQIGRVAAIERLLADHLIVVPTAVTSRSHAA